MQVSDVFDQVTDELRGAWRFRWLGLAAAWVVCLVGWAYIYTIPDKFEANARVYVNTASILRPLLQGLAIDPDVASGLDMVRQILQSRTQVEKVARETGLDVMARTDEEREGLIRDIQSRITIEAADLRARTTQGEGLYRISFTDSDRKKGIEVVDTMLKAFVENALGEKRIGQEDAQRFFDDEIARVEALMREAEGRLADFKRDNVGMMPGTQADYFAKLQAVTAERDDVRSRLSIAERRRAEIQRQLDGEEPFLFGMDDSGTVSSSASSSDVAYRIRDLEKQLEELRLNYTDNHPDVKAMRSTIEDLTKKRDEELARVRGGQKATGDLANSLKSNPAYRALQMDLNRTQVQIEELREELKLRQADVSNLFGKVDAVPDVEAKLSNLNRDYDSLRQQHSEYLRRRETAVLSESADRAGTLKFDTIDTPSASLEPISPDRPRLLAMVLGAGIALGGGLAWLMNQLYPVFHTAKKLEIGTGLKVLSSVSRTWLERHRRTRRAELAKFSAVAGLLLVTFGVTLILQQGGVEQLLQMFG